MQHTILDKYIIDTREENAFRSKTFSGYKKGDVTKELINCLMSNQYEQCHYWCAELICSGHFEELWDTLISYTGKHINIGNPKVPIYLHMRVDQFREIARKNNDTDLSLRNNLRIRRVFAEIIGVLMSSKNRLCAHRVKVCTTGDEFDLMNMSSKLRAPDITFVKDFFKEADPKELYIPINEMGYHLSKLSKDAVEACYWLEWMLEYENQTNKRKDKCVCAQRENPLVNEKYQTDIIWLIWEVILYYGDNCTAPISRSKSISPTTKSKIIRSLFNLFSLRYNARIKTRRIQLLYFAVNIITTTTIEDVDIIENKELIHSYADNADLIYKELKKNEIVEMGKEEIADYICDKLIIKHESSSKSSSSSEASSRHKMDILCRGLDMGNTTSSRVDKNDKRKKGSNSEELSSMEKSIMKMNILDNVSISSLSMLPSPSQKNVPGKDVSKEQVSPAKSKAVHFKIEELK
jgi:hypothetical protein